MPSPFAMLLCALSAVAGALPSASPIQPARVRPLNAFSRALLADGIHRSATIARLVVRIERSDLVVYLRADTDPQTRTATTRFMVASGGVRYLLVSINPRNQHDAILALLGHELEHASEVADAPRVKDAASFLALYQRIGQRSLSGHEFETAEADAAGRAVRLELANGARVAEHGGAL